MAQPPEITGLQVSIQDLYLQIGSLQRKHKTLSRRLKSPLSNILNPQYITSELCNTFHASQQATLEVALLEVAVELTFLRHYLYDMAHDQSRCPKCMIGSPLKGRWPFRNDSLRYWESDYPPPLQWAKNRRPGSSSSAVASMGWAQALELKDGPGRTVQLQESMRRPKPMRAIAVVQVLEAS